MNIHMSFFGQFETARCGAAMTEHGVELMRREDPEALGEFPWLDGSRDAVTYADWDAVTCCECLKKQGQPAAALRNPESTSPIPWPQRARRILAGVYRVAP